MDRRDFLKLAGIAALGEGHAQRALGLTEEPATRKADYTLKIGKSQIELAPGRTVTTTTCNGQFPGPLLRLREGRRVSVELVNNTQAADQLAWHGLTASPPLPLPAHGCARVELTPGSTALGLYHSNILAGTDLAAGSYGGQAGPIIIEPSHDRGGFDREVVLMLKEFEPSLTGWSSNGYDIEYNFFTINGRMLGSGEPIRVKSGERVLFHVLNASATAIRRLALPGHRFEVVALDGSAVPTPGHADVLWLGPAETVSALVTMNRPGIWILGDLNDDDRKHGMGIILEYAGQSGTPRWIAPPAARWDYTPFGAGSAPRPDEILDLVFASASPARNGFKHWTVNGESFSLQRMQPRFQVHTGRRYRLRMRNSSDEIFPVHLQGQPLELVAVAGRPTAGLIKDVVMLAAHQQVAVDFVPNSPGRRWLYCHRQLHRDFGFMAAMDYI